MSKMFWNPVPVSIFCCFSPIIVFVKTWHVKLIWFSLYWVWIDFALLHFTEEEGVPAESISNIDLDLELRHRNNVVVNRPLYSEDEFRKDFKVRERQKASVPDKVKSWVKPGDINKKSVKKFFFGLIPILAWLPKYGLRKQLLPDVISGFTVGVYRLPQGNYWFTLVRCFQTIHTNV